MAKKIRSREVYKFLTRIFSGPITVNKAITPMAARHPAIRSTGFKSASQNSSFRRMGYNPIADLSSRKFGQMNRIERYIDFDEMENEPIIASALDLYASEVTSSSDFEDMLTIRSSNEEIKYVLEELYYNTLNIEANAYSWVRSTVKKGDYFLYLDVDEDMGVIQGITLPTNELERLEGEDPTNPFYTQFQWNSGGKTFENWQVAHFRLLGDDKYYPYGSSILDPVRRTFRQLVLMEDWMMAYRIVRSSERNIYYLYTGDIPNQEVEQYVEGVMSSLKRSTIVNPDTGKVDLRYNPFSVEEDIIIPVRGDNYHKVETLKGGQFTGEVGDIEYIREKLIAGLKAPKSRLLETEGSSEGSGSLAQKDLAFSKIIQRIQQSIASELRKIGQIHLTVLGYSMEDAAKFTLSFNNPSKVAALQELENLNMKLETATKAVESKFYSRTKAAKEIIGMTDDEIEKEIYDRFLDAKVDMSLEGGSSEVGDMGGMGGSGSGFDMGDMGDEDFGGMDLGDLDGGGDDDLGSGDEDILLSAPGNRDSDSMRPGEKYETSGSKGKVYEKGVLDGRRSSGRKRSVRSHPLVKSSAGRRSRPSSIPQSLRSLSTGDRLAKGIISEGLRDEIKSTLRKKKKDLFKEEAEVLDGNSDAQ